MPWVPNIELSGLDNTLRWLVSSTHPHSPWKTPDILKFPLASPCTIYPSGNATHCQHCHLGAHTAVTFNHCPLLDNAYPEPLNISPFPPPLITVATFIEFPYVPSITKGALHMSFHSHVTRTLWNRYYYLHLLDEVQENLVTCLGS